MNGITEHSIGSISTWMLTMLLHTQVQWPQVINKDFWPFAMWHAINIFVNCYQGWHGNAIPPIEEFTNAAAPLWLEHLHPWGCPVYVLNKHLQDDNHPHSKWDWWSWLGVYIRHSTIHSGNVVLVYNLVTGHTTPQFHVVFDDHFHTVVPNPALSSPTALDDLLDHLWQTSQWTYDGDIPPEYLFGETSTSQNLTPMLHQICKHPLASSWPLIALRT